MERPALGKGLSALIPQGEKPREKIQTLEIDKIKTSDRQPRATFSQVKLQELADSIGEKGVIQPILVRPEGDGFQVIAGERRLRAARLGGFKEIPAIVREVKDEDALELALIENIQREELTKVEEAKAYARLATDFNLTHEEIARKVSKDRTTISNTLRLLELPEKIQNFLEESTITMGHAKAILSLDDPVARMRLCERIVKKGLSVREAEHLSRLQLSPAGERRRKPRQDIHLAAVEDKLQHHLGTRVRISQGKKRGRITIDFYSTDDLNRILTVIVPEA